MQTPLQPHRSFAIISTLAMRTRVPASLWTPQTPQRTCAGAAQVLARPTLPCRCAGKVWQASQGCAPPDWLVVRVSTCIAAAPCLAPCWPGAAAADGGWGLRLGISGGISKPSMVSSSSRFREGLGLGGKPSSRVGPGGGLPAGAWGVPGLCGAELGTGP